MNKHRTKILGRLQILILLALSPLVRAEQWAFVSLNKERAVAVYSLGESDGMLTLKQKSTTTGNPSAMCVSSAGQHLYVAMQGGSIAAYRIGDDASLALLGEVNVGDAPAYLSVHPGGRHLISAYYSAGKVALHAITPDGSLSTEPLQMFQTDQNAHSAVFDPSGKFAFVSHTQPNAIFQFRFDAATGKLTANDPAKLQREPKTGPRHLWFHPSNGLAYGSDEQGNGATAYRFDPKTGTLSVVQSISSLPEGGHQGKTTTSEIEVHPSGQFVYIANRGYNFIASFRVGDDGRLTPLQHTPTEAVTRSFYIAPDGRYLVAAGQNTGDVAVFRIGADGMLERTSTLAAGKSPWWVLIVNRDGKKTSS